MLGKLLLIKMLLAIGFVVMLMHVLFFVVALTLHVLCLAPPLRKIVMKRNSSRHACC